MAKTLNKFQVRLLSPWQTRLETSEVLFSSEIPTEKADALLCEWAPSDELFSFPRRKAWYCCEPDCQFRLIQQGTWPDIRDRLAPSEFLYHGHSDQRYRVPHITHIQPLTANTHTDRKQKAVAIVSNFGGSPRMRHPEIAYRNQFITHPMVDLFGRAGWQRYRRKWYSWPRPPRNYIGEIPGDWPENEKRTLQSAYSIAACFENMREPHYFTEKFVEAVTAGCIPVYRAHESLAQTVLRGAAWIDPADHDSDPRKTYRFAAEQCLHEFQAQNSQWLQKNSNLQQTAANKVFERIGSILAHE